MIYQLSFIMKNIQVKEAQLIFDSGVLTSCEVVRTIMESQKQWTVILTRKDKVKFSLRGQRGDAPRVFKSVDAAVNSAGEIGFRQITVAL
jgi:hypothetical protein